MMCHDKQKRFGPLDRISPGTLYVDLSADVRVSNNHPPFEHGERIALHQNAIFEGAGLGFVRIADDVMRPGGSFSDRVPFASGWKGSTSATDEIRSGHFADDSVRAQLDGTL